MKNLDTSKIIQILIDGSNTNLKFLEELKKTRTTDELNDIINIGTCNLRTVHGAFKTGVLSSGWDIKKLLKSSQCILHDTPAKREDYFNITGSTKYALPFVSTRWRLIELWPNIVKIFDFWEGLVKSKRQSSKSYLNVLNHIKDKLIVPKLHIFAYVTGIMQPHLICHQVDGPTVSFMNDDIQNLFSNLPQMVVKPKILTFCTEFIDLVKIELEDENLLFPKKIHLGFAVEDEVCILLAAKHIDGVLVKELRLQSRTFVVEILKKLFVRNPLGFVVVRHAIFMNPKIIIKKGKDYYKLK